MRYPYDAERIAAITTRFRHNEFSEAVFRASLFAIGLRGDDIASIVYEEKEKIYEASSRISRFY